MSSTNRREFLQKGALSLAGLTVVAGRKGALLASPLGLPIGLELYTVRNQMKADVAGTLKKVAEIGYEEVETDGVNFRNPAFVRALKDTGLKCVSGHYDYASLGSGWAERIADAQKDGLRYMVCSFVPESERQSLEGWKQVAKVFNQAGEQCRSAGIQFAYHAHNFEYRTFNGTVGYDELLRSTDAKLVQMEMDCYWASRAGQDPVHYFKLYPGRFPLLHIKDMKGGHTPTTDIQKGGDAFTEVGRGVIDWKRIFKAATAAGTQHYYVEQDQCEGSPLVSIKISYDYLKSLQV